MIMKMVDISSLNVNPTFVSEDGIFGYVVNDRYHREGGPAQENDDGQSWWLNGDLHRIGGPAIERKDGSRHWAINGKHHREDGPAIELSSGYKMWFLNGQMIQCQSNEEFFRIKNLMAIM